MKFADLHIHTNYSDSTYTPKEVVELSLKEGLSCISITDHDIIEGIVPVIQEAKSTDLEIIPGIEMTTEVDAREIHILGYFLDIQNKELTEKLDDLKQVRIDRLDKMVKKLNALGLKDIHTQEVIDLAGHAAVGRVHLAMVMKAKGYISSIMEAFNRFISDRGPAYVSQFRFSPKEIIEVIKKAGGVSVVAHPHTLAREELIAEFVSYGLKGLEGYYPDYNEQKRKYYSNLAKKYGILVTGGSDAHGTVKDNTAIGKVKIPYELVEALKNAR